MRFIGAVITGFSVFLGSMIAMSGNPVLGVLVGAAGGIVAGAALYDEST